MVVCQALRRLFYVRMRHGEFDPQAMVPYRDEAKFGEDAYGQREPNPHAPVPRVLLISR
jgi:hypothetical protein